MKRLLAMIVSAGSLALSASLIGCGAGQSGALGPAPTGPDRPVSPAVSPTAGHAGPQAPTATQGTSGPAASVTLTPAPVATNPANPVPVSSTPTGGLPAITVLTPASGTRVTSPVTVSGTADVFEGVVSVQILDSAGHEIARTFTTASCGTGCRGVYSVAVAYRVQVAGQGTIEVFERSAKDGSPINVQLIRVTLEP